MSTPEDGIEQRIKQREDQFRNGLETKPIASAIPHGNIPNTPLASSFIAFLLGSVFTLGSLLFLLGGIPGSFWLTYRLGFFVATWSLFHYLEFAVTAGWNREKCSVDCECHHLQQLTGLDVNPNLAYLLDNGAMYHIANGVALTEYILTSLWKPEAKSFAYVSEIGKSSLSFNVMKLF
jgi:protein-S-isoprenylcysteine O-methyltransferase